MPRISNTSLRLTLVIGAAVFLLVGLAGFFIAGAFLAYPPGYSKALIIAIEVMMTISVAGTLVLLVAGPPERGERPLTPLRYLDCAEPFWWGWACTASSSILSLYERSLPSTLLAAACSWCSASLHAEERPRAVRSIHDIDVA